MKAFSHAHMHVRIPSCTQTNNPKLTDESGVTKSGVNPRTHTLPLTHIPPFPVCIEQIGFARSCCGHARRTLQTCKTTLACARTHVCPLTHTITSACILSKNKVSGGAPFLMRLHRLAWELVPHTSPARPHSFNLSLLTTAELPHSPSSLQSPISKSCNLQVCTH